MKYFVICYDSYHLIFDYLIYYMSCSLICCLDSSDFDCWNNLYSYCLNSFYFCCMMNFVIYCWNSCLFLGFEWELDAKTNSVVFEFDRE